MEGRDVRAFLLLGALTGVLWVGEMVSRVLWRFQTSPDCERCGCCGMRRQRGEWVCAGGCDWMGHHGEHHQTGIQRS